jgi:16S rRNA A1518/A1519 N6-dimethyltransferase RsmA/KsgA/DIM1 with predicted DNA glycosylase/AP lyase activity
LNAAGIDPMRRAQTVSIAEYARLSNTLAAAQCPDV